MQNDPIWDYNVNQMAKMLSALQKRQTYGKLQGVPQFRKLKGLTI
jgi:hypothetical protein